MIVKNYLLGSGELMLCVVSMKLLARGHVLDGIVFGWRKKLRRSMLITLYVSNLRASAEAVREYWK